MKRLSGPEIAASALGADAPESKLEPVDQAIIDAYQRHFKPAQLHPGQVVRFDQALERRLEARHWRRLRSMVACIPVAAVALLLLTFWPSAVPTSQDADWVGLMDVLSSELSSSPGLLSDWGLFADNSGLDTALADADTLFVDADLTALIDSDALQEEWLPDDYQAFSWLIEAPTAGAENE